MRTLLLFRSSRMRVMISSAWLRLPSLTPVPFFPQKWYWQALCYSLATDMMKASTGARPLKYSRFPLFSRRSEEHPLLLRTPRGNKI
jgi:hypothetical protein